MNVGRIAFSPFNRNALGFDNLFADLDQFLSSDTSKTSGSGYPPHNLIKVDVDKYLVEIAASGFLQDELNITVKDGYLTVVGEKTQKDDNINYLYKGIGARSFVKSFKIADTITVTEAAFKDGILSVALVNVIPEKMKERKIEIGTNISGSNQQLLTEADKVK